MSEIISFFVLSVAMVVLSDGVVLSDPVSARVPVCETAEDGLFTRLRNVVFRPCDNKTRAVALLPVLFVVVWPVVLVVSDSITVFVVVPESIVPLVLVLVSPVVLFVTSLPSTRVL